MHQILTKNFPKFQNLQNRRFTKNIFVVGGTIFQHIVYFRVYKKLDSTLAWLVKLGMPSFTTEDFHDTVSNTCIVVSRI